MRKTAILLALACAFARADYGPGTTDSDLLRSGTPVVTNAWLAVSNETVRIARSVAGDAGAITDGTNTIDAARNVYATSHNWQFTGQRDDDDISLTYGSDAWTMIVYSDSLGTDMSSIVTNENVTRLVFNFPDGNRAYSITAVRDVPTYVGRLALTNDIPTVTSPDFTTNNAQLVATIEAKAPAPGDYATVSNRAMNAVLDDEFGEALGTALDDGGWDLFYDWLPLGLGYIDENSPRYYRINHAVYLTNDVVEIFATSGVGGYFKIEREDGTGFCMTNGAMELWGNLEIARVGMVDSLWDLSGLYELHLPQTFHIGHSGPELNLADVATHQQATNAATAVADAKISTNNAAFVAAVTNCPVSHQGGGGADWPIGDFGQYGTIGAIIAALVAASTWLKSHLRYELHDVVLTGGAGTLLDRAGNRVVVSGDTTLTLPEANPGYLRDFLVRLEISGSTVPTITFAAPTGETITYETDGDEFPVPDEAGDWLYSFTESCVAHKFAVSLKKVNEVAAPQAQGGS